MGCTSSAILETKPESIPESIPEPKMSVIETTVEGSLSYTERRNSQKEKNIIIKDQTKLARIELGRRMSYRQVIHSKCTRCGDLGPEHSNQYYGYYLVVPDINTKNKCRRCNLYFSFEHFGVVKSVDDAITMIIEEMTE